jgi:hypothetical protein
MGKKTEAKSEKAAKRGENPQGNGRLGRPWRAHYRRRGRIFCTGRPANGWFLSTEDQRLVVCQACLWKLAGLALRKTRRSRLKA